MSGLIPAHTRWHLNQSFRPEQTRWGNGPGLWICSKGVLCTQSVYILSIWRQTCEFEQGSGGLGKEVRSCEFLPWTEVTVSHVQVNLLTHKWRNTKSFGSYVLGWRSITLLHSCELFCASVLTCLGLWPKSGNGCRLNSPSADCFIAFWK